MHGAKYTTRCGQCLVVGPGTRGTFSDGQRSELPSGCRQDVNPIESGRRRSGTMHTFELCRAHSERFSCFVARPRRTVTLIPALHQQPMGRA